MGQTLSEPVTTKETAEDTDARLYWGASGMQGWRISMEDAHTVVLGLNGVEDVAFFGVYDGHGGSRVAKYVGIRLHQRIAEDPAFARGEYADALRCAYLGMDYDMRNDPEYAQETSGCTAVCALFVGNDLYVANVGDSRAVISQRGAAVPLSLDHKPTNEPEIQRIVAAGGFVEFGRVNGNLALSRAIGDFEFKQNKFMTPEQQIVTANPDIRKYYVRTTQDGVNTTEEEKNHAEDEFLILACDGIWDVVSNQEAVNFVRRCLATGCSLGECAERLMDRCLASDTEMGGVGCDNMTVIIVGILGGRDLNAWRQWVSEGVEPLEGVVPRESALLTRRKSMDVGTDTELDQLQTLSSVQSMDNVDVAGSKSGNNEEEAMASSSQVTNSSVEKASHGP